jgi:MYXO-CTERM domain-containing protein
MTNKSWGGCAFYSWQPEKVIASAAGGMGIRNHPLAGDLANKAARPGRPIGEGVMNFKDLAIGAALAIGLLSTPAAHAEVMYFYTGNGFTTFEPLGSGNPYNNTDKVTATIVLSNPLGNNFFPSLVTPVAFSLSDGVQTITDTSPSVQTRFLFATNATGQIVRWDVEVALATGPQADYIDTVNVDAAPLPAILDKATLYVDGADYSASNQANPGMWTAVPAPPLSNPTALGVLALVFLWRRRRQILGFVQ